MSGNIYMGAPVALTTLPSGAITNAAAQARLERTAYLISFLHQRARSVGMNGGKRVLPITQQHVADTLGLSLVHTNKTLRKLAARKLMRWQDRGCEILDLDGLLALAGWEGLQRGPRPFI